MKMNTVLCGTLRIGFLAELQHALLEHEGKCIFLKGLA